MDTSLQLEPNSQVLDSQERNSQEPNSQEPNSPEPPSQEPTFELPPGTLDFIPDEITPTKNLALSFIRERYRDTAPINTGASHLLAKVRIATTTGSHRRRQGTWKACCALRTQPATELVPPFALLRPDTVSEDETPAKFAEVDSLEWPSDLSPSAGEVLDVELWMQRRPGRTQGSSQRTEYHAYIPVVTAYLRDARSLIHVSFDNWTSTGGKLGLTGICVHMMDDNGSVKDFVLGLLELHGQHSGVNIASVVATTLTNFGINKDSVGYFVLDNAYNNDTAVASLADLYGFELPERRLRCCCHILNLGAQVIIWGKDRDAYENDGGNLEVSLATSPCSPKQDMSCG
jgi:hypothetical protein